MENLRQYEFCHQLLETVLVGGVRNGEATPTSSSGRVEKKASKWRLFHRRTDIEKQSGAGRGDDKGKKVSSERPTKKEKGKKSKKISGKVKTTHYM